MFELHSARVHNFKSANENHIPWWLNEWTSVLFVCFWKLAVVSIWFENQTKAPRFLEAVQAALHAWKADLKPVQMLYDKHNDSDSLDVSRLRSSPFYSLPLSLIRIFFFLFLVFILVLFIVVVAFCFVKCGNILTLL